jgi:hypothetical protein
MKVAGAKSSEIKSGWQDSNLRPPVPKVDNLLRFYRKWAVFNKYTLKNTQIFEKCHLKDNNLFR